MSLSCITIMSPACDQQKKRVNVSLKGRRMICSDTCATMKVVTPVCDVGCSPVYVVGCYPVYDVGCYPVYDVGCFSCL